MYKREELPDADRFNPERPNLCANLRWKGMFVWADKDDTVPPSNSAYFWCLHTQNCLGPDGKVAEPGDCDKAGRQCHNANVTMAQVIASSRNAD